MLSRIVRQSSRSGGTSVLGLELLLLRPAGVRSAALLPSPPSLFAAAVAAARIAVEPRPVKYEPHVLAGAAAPPDPPTAASVQGRQSVSVGTDLSVAGAGAHLAQDMNPDRGAASSSRMYPHDANMHVLA